MNPEERVTEEIVRREGDGLGGASADPRRRLAKCAPVAPFFVARAAALSHGFWASLSSTLSNSSGSSLSSMRSALTTRMRSTGPEEEDAADGHHVGEDVGAVANEDGDGGGGPVEDTHQRGGARSPVTRIQASQEWRKER